MPSCERKALELQHALGSYESGILSLVHGRCPCVVGASLDGYVAVDISHDCLDNPEPVAGVLERPPLLDVHLDPSEETIQNNERARGAI